MTDTFLSLIDETAPSLVGGLYLHGSLGFGEWYAGRSDVDFVAVLSAPVPPDLLRAVHEELGVTFQRPSFDGFYCTWDDLTQSPYDVGELPCVLGGVFSDEERHDVNPVTWHELAFHGVRVRGPALENVRVWTDQQVLRKYTHDNLREYWAPQIEALRRFPDEAGQPEMVAWMVLGTSRLHHLLATDRLTSKTGAGLYAERAFDATWHELVGEALSWRAVGLVSPDYDRDRMAEQVVAFCEHVVNDGLAIPV